MGFADFPLGPFVFSTGGLIFLAGVIVATWMLTRTVHEKGLSLQFLSVHFLPLALASFVFGRIAKIWKFWDYFANELVSPTLPQEIELFLKKFILFWHEGLDPFWTALGFLLAFLLLAYRKKENLWKWLDAFVLPTILIIMFWSLGAFFSGWNYGRPVSDSYWFGVTYDLQEVRYSIPLHPVQIYALLYYGILFILGLRWWTKHTWKKDGTFFGILTWFVFFGNGLLEFFRGDTVALWTIGSVEIRASQLMSFVMVVGLTFFLILHTHPEILQQEMKNDE